MKFKVSICAPTYKRADNIQTHKYLPFVKYYVSEDEIEAYQQNNPEAIFISAPREQQGNLCRIRNYILDQEMPDNDAVLIVDDDLSGVFRYQGGKSRIIQADEFIAMVRHYSIICKDFGFKFWGLNVNPDKQNYREYTPFSTVSYIGGPFQCFIDGNPLRYDEALPLKEDYDMTLQNCLEYRGALRVNGMFYQAKQGKQSGGVATIRNLDKEQQQFEALQLKWGSKIIKRDNNDRSHSRKKEKKNVDYNPVLKVPIKGV